MSENHSVDFVEALLGRMPPGLPRYTSYPPANHFKPGIGAGLRDKLLSAAREAKAISAYIHIPYCDRLCWFCGCHTKQTLRYDPIRAYVESLTDEISLMGKAIGKKVPLSRLHLGGGSPSLLQDHELKAIRDALEDIFIFSPETEISVEIDPSDVKDSTIDNLVAFGLTRASIGVQDFDPLVQTAINRPQTFEDTKRVVDALREAGIRSVNIDALYGLPLQTSERLTRTIEQVLSLKPDRIALFGYAHVPWMKPHQKMINEADLPDTKQRFHDARHAGQMVTSAGYDALGIDHFALPHDSLAIAARDGRLNRNFQGYTDDSASVLLGFGPSSIGQFSGGYVQNEPATGQYIAAVKRGELTLSRGLALSDDDRMRGWIIERLMCDFAFSLAELHKQFGHKANYLELLAREVAAEDTDRLCAIENGIFKVLPHAWPFVRLVAAKFDAWLSIAPGRYSKAV